SNPPVDLESQEGLNAPGHPEHLLRRNLPDQLARDPIAGLHHDPPRQLVDPVMEVPKDADGLLAVFHAFSWCRLRPAGIQRLPFPEPADLAVRPDGVDTVC